MIRSPGRRSEILRKWIKEGAAWGEHWAYVPVRNPQVPQSETFFGLITSKSNWANNPVDNFIEQKYNGRRYKTLGKG
jgi:hypothetical protein